MSIVATEAALDQLRPLVQGLLRQIRIGRPVAELAAELARGGSAPRLTVGEIEAGLWSFVRDELTREAATYGRQLAAAAGDGGDDAWPDGRPVSVEAVLRALGQRQAPPPVVEHIAQTVREAYGEARRR